MLGWIIFCAIQYIRNSKKLIARSDFKGHVRCEKCGTVYEVSPKEFTNSYMVKSQSVTKTKRKGIAFINKPVYKYYAKKFYCPHCKKKMYAQVLNINEINVQMQAPSMKIGIRWLILMFVGGLVIMAAMSIPMHFANKYREHKVENMKRQYYEELKDRYGL